ncbi:MAG TPA: DivIVA domain-containing protein, partial [Solirubrobacter sp.]
MAPSGESHSIFVVQQTFRTVRRGYDPDEVDRHLELVAEMFRSSRDMQLQRDLQRREGELRHEVDAAKLEA